MYLRSIRLHHFRGYKDASFQFSPGINHIIGKNAIGKTTILEAIHLLMCGRSFRGSHNAELISSGASAFFIEASFVKHEVEQVIRLSYDGRRKKIIINHTECHAYADLLGVITGVVFTPDDAAIIKGAPAGRRQFLDLHICQFDPLFVHYSSRYQKAMKQRNALLRSGDISSILPWEVEMAKAAEYMTAKRRVAAEELNQVAKELYQRISKGKPSLSLGLKSTLVKESDLPVKERYLGILKRNRPKEKECGVTFVGPHKDDLNLYLENKELKLFGSEGEQRSAIASLRLATWRRLFEYVGIKPLMLVDDVGISLDQLRQKELSHYFQELGQVFLTSTDSLPYTESVHTIRL